MTKNEFILDQLKKKYPDLVKQEETSYIFDYMKRKKSEEHFKKFVEKLNLL